MRKGATLKSKAQTSRNGVSLEDFGTGYAALTRLRELPFDRIKIDRTFVQSLNYDRHSGSIVAAITALGKSLSLPITAEGIEEVRGQKILLDSAPPRGRVGSTATRYLARKPPSFSLN
jgi:EAL domain-containing protein (putative c-di-GMP-specific phosphodiesterase class I)